MRVLIACSIPPPPASRRPDRRRASCFWALSDMVRAIDDNRIELHSRVPSAHMPSPLTPSALRTMKPDSPSRSPQAWICCAELSCGLTCIYQYVSAVFCVRTQALKNRIEFSHHDDVYRSAAPVPMAITPLVGVSYLFSADGKTRYSCSESSVSRDRGATGLAHHKSPWSVDARARQRARIA